MENTQGSSRLIRKLSPLAVWALAFGCSVGWGAFVMPGTTFLPIAGPLGTVLGIAVGTAVMMLIGVNYAYLMNRHPDAGGTFTYAKRLFGTDHGFLAAWFMGLVYLAIIWANATAIPLIFRNIFGDLLQFGKLYTIAGYDVYVGEILISLAAELIFLPLCLRGCRATGIVQTVLALLLLGGVLFGFGAAFLGAKDGIVPDLQPLYSPQNTPQLGMLLIVFLAPWAFAGFESVSHSVEEFKFSPKKGLRIMVIALVSAAAAYILLALLGASAQPDGAGNWYEYLQHLGDYSRVEGLPTFYGAYRAAGSVGIAVLGVAAAAAIITGLVGNATAASRMIYAMSRDDMLPGVFSKLNRHGAPKNAILFLLLVSLPIPFLGRAAIGWIVDVNTIGVTIAYAYTSASAARAARQDGRRAVQLAGWLGVAVSLFFLAYFLLPNLSSVAALGTESYLMLMAWAVLGFILFYLLFRRDRIRTMGTSTMVWVVLLLLITFTSMVWILNTTRDVTAAAVQRMGDLHAQGATEAEFEAMLDWEIDAVSGTIIRNTVVQLLMISVSLFVIFHTYTAVRKRHTAAVEGRTAAEESSKAKTAFLSNMSHDIRTPMNAIIGYVTLAKREPGMTPRTADFLNKIEASGGQLLSLINDVLEMSRIESGRMELAPVPTDLRTVMQGAKSMFATQMETKGLQYEVRCENLSDPYVLCDKNCLDRVLLNLISNAYKYTPEGGAVTVTLTQTGKKGDDAQFKLSVKDTGIGMSPEFAARVFEAYEREKTQTVENIQGTGLGTAITKSIVELMGGSIEVFSEQGKGSEFVVSVALPVDIAAAANAALTAAEKAPTALAGKRLLLVEDDPDNREVERTLLEESGFLIVTADNGEDAVERIAASTPGEYDAVLMDIEMPVKNGYAAAKLIRSLKNPALANIPIVALTAKAFGEDVAAAREAGMNGHIAKPLNMHAALEVLTDVLR